MSVLIGTKVLLGYYKNGIWKQFARSKKCTLKTSMQLQKTSAPGWGVWQNYNPEMHTWSVSCGCLLVDDEQEVWDLYVNRKTFKVELRCEEFPSMTFWGEAFIKSLNNGNPIHQVSTFDIEMTGNGELHYGSETTRVTLYYYIKDNLAVMYVTEALVGCQVTATFTNGKTVTLKAGETTAAGVGFDTDDTISNTINSGVNANKYSIRPLNKTVVRTVLFGKHNGNPDTYALESTDLDTTICMGVRYSNNGVMTTKSVEMTPSTDNPRCTVFMKLTAEQATTAEVFVLDCPDYMTVNINRTTPKYVYYRCAYNEDNDNYQIQIFVNSADRNYDIEMVEYGASKIEALHTAGSIGYTNDDLPQEQAHVVKFKSDIRNILSLVRSEQINVFVTTSWDSDLQKTAVKLTMDTVIGYPLAVTCNGTAAGTVPANTASHTLYIDADDLDSISITCTNHYEYWPVVVYGNKLEKLSFTSLDRGYTNLELVGANSGNDIAVEFDTGTGSDRSYKEGTIKNGLYKLTFYVGGAPAHINNLRMYDHTARRYLVNIPDGMCVHVDHIKWMASYTAMSNDTFRHTVTVMLDTPECIDFKVLYGLTGSTTKNTLTIPAGQKQASFSFTNQQMHPSYYSITNDQNTHYTVDNIGCDTTSVYCEIQNEGTADATLRMYIDNDTENTSGINIKYGDTVAGTIEEYGTDTYIDVPNVTFDVIKASGIYAESVDEEDERLFKIVFID